MKGHVWPVTGYHGKQSVSGSCRVWLLLLQWEGPGSAVPGDCREHPHVMMLGWAGSHVLPLPGSLAAKDDSTELRAFSVSSACQIFPLSALRMCVPPLLQLWFWLGLHQLALIGKSKKNFQKTHLILFLLVIFFYNYFPHCMASGIVVPPTRGSNPNPCIETQSFNL